MNVKGSIPHKNFQKSASEMNVQSALYSTDHANHGGISSMHDDNRKLRE